MTVIIVAVLFVVIGTLAYVALRNAQDFSDANEVVPGVKTNAPKEWAGAHTVEAKLHRRLRDAVAAMRANRQLDAADLTDIRASVEREALAIDERLVALARLPGRRRVDELGPIDDAVSALEDLVADIVLLRGPGAEDPTAGIARIRTRLDMVREARAELAGLTGGFEELRQEIERQVDPELLEPDKLAPDVAEPGISATDVASSDVAEPGADTEPTDEVDGEEGAAQ